MKKSMSLKQLAANRQNARNSTGPRTPAGRAVSKMNATKHGILSKQVLVRGSNIQESRRELTALHQRFREQLQPVGPVEEMLVDKIVTAHWRLRRALTAELGEIALSVDEGQWQRQCNGLRFTRRLWDLQEDPARVMMDSAFGNRFMENQLRSVRAAVEKDGELTETAIQTVVFRGKPYGLTRDFEALRAEVQRNPGGLEPVALRAKQKEQALAFLDKKLRLYSWAESDCENRERLEEEARQAAAVLPSVAVLDKIMRDETTLERQQSRAMAQLERLQRMRRGESVPAPMSVEVSERG
jgi:chaperonin cofactor prefoldin